MKSHIFPRIIIFAFYVIIQLCSLEGADEETRLREELFVNRKIDIHSRPTKFANESTDVKFGIVITSIIELNERSEILTINLFLGHHWTDENLKWKSEDFGNLNILSVRSEQIWTPDICLLNNAEASKVNPSAKVSLIVLSDGSVWYWPPTTLNSICPIDVKNFPFDEQTCNLKFTSWTYSGRQVNLTLFGDNDLITHWIPDQNNVWEIISAFGNVTTKSYGKVIFQEVDFFIQLRRRAPYFQLTILLPTVTAILITLYSFWLPPSFKDRILVSGFALLVFTILVIHLFWVIPRSGSSVSGIVVCCGNAMFFAGLTFLLSIITGSLYHRSPDYPPPDWLKNLLSSWLSVILCLTTPSGRRMSSGNAQLLSEEEGQEDSANIVESKSEVSEWQLLAVAFDRIGFITYCVIMCIILISSFA